MRLTCFVEFLPSKGGLKWGRATVASKDPATSSWRPGPSDQRCWCWFVQVVWRTGCELFAAANRGLLLPGGAVWLVWGATGTRGSVLQQRHRRQLPYGVSAISPQFCHKSSLSSSSYLFTLDIFLVSFKFCYIFLFLVFKNFVTLFLFLMKSFIWHPVCTGKSVIWSVIQHC